LYTQAAAGGSLKAKRNLAYMYYFGAGVRRDYKKAADMFRETAEAGLGKAEYDLGRLYYRGQGVAKDMEKAAKHFRKAAKNGHGGAQFFMGRLRMLGEGLERDMTKAYYWLTLSAAQNTDKASRLRRKVSAKLNDTQIAEAEKAAQAFHPK
jgi:TPR repeat protein